MKSLLKKWVLPPAMSYILSAWVYSLLFRKNFSTLKRIKKKSNRLFVLATGPSLKSDVEKYGKELNLHDVAVMNQFAESSLFLTLKPYLYFFADGLYFKKENELGSTVAGKLARVRNVLLNKVDWPLIVVCPDKAKDSELVEIISANKFISVIFYNSRSSPDGRLGLWLMKRGFVSPPAQTVTTVALGIGIIVGYSDLLLLGADSSMHMMMNVNQKTNEMYLGNEHFYGKNKEKSFIDSAETKSVTVGYWLGCVSKMFLCYERINVLAKYCGVKVVNASSFSWIDSLDRPNEKCN